MRDEKGFHYQYNFSQLFKFYNMKKKYVMAINYLNKSFLLSLFVFCSLNQPNVLRLTFFLLFDVKHAFSDLIMV